MSEYLKHIQSIPCVLPIQHCTPAGREMFQAGHASALKQAEGIAATADAHIASLTGFLGELIERLGQGHLADGFDFDSRYNWVTRGQEVLDKAKGRGEDGTTNR